MMQETALNIMKRGEDVFLTGGPGSGKTHTLNQFISFLNEHNINAALTAPTGIAASHIGGVTLHSFFGLGRRDSLSQYDIEELLEKKYLYDRMKDLSVLIIDEVSMLSPAIFESIDRILRAFKQTPEAFGGVQLILTGDFFQLPPVSQQSEGTTFIFQTKLWQELNLHICYLNGSYRHTDDTLLSILNEIRNMEVSEKTMELLRTRYAPSTKAHVTKLYTHNANVDSINKQMLQELEGEKKVFEAFSKGAKNWVEKIFKGSLLEEQIELKVGALVIFIKNNYDEDYINGTLGTVVGFSDLGYPVVETYDGREITVSPISFGYHDNDGKLKAEVRQVPLRLAWAITIHKSQGMTLDQAEIDLSQAFEAGQGYVALSRLSSLDGLHLRGLNDMALSVHPLVSQVDADMRARSQQTENQEQATDHETLIANYAGEAGSPTKQNTSTYKETKKLIQEQCSLEDMAEKRDLSMATIINHVRKLSDLDVELDISYLQPSISIIEKVEAAYNKLKDIPENYTEGGIIKRKAIYDELNEEVSYHDIDLALLFI